jgi:hypothetical protein
MHQHLPQARQLLGTVRNLPRAQTTCLQNSGRESFRRLPR